MSEGECLWTRLGESHTPQLVREPENTYDHQAIRVDWRGRKLGYLPRIQNYTVAQMPDRGERLHARIAELTVDDTPWKRRCKPSQQSPLALERALAWKCPL